MFTVRNDAGERRHFMLKDGRPVEVASHEEGFGTMLLETHPTQRIEAREGARAHRYSLCWAPIQTYRSRSAELLAAARERREEGAVERAAEENPLFADQVRSGEWRREKKWRGR